MYGSAGSVDGSKSSTRSCSITNSRYQAWWAVDLEKQYRVQKVVVTTRNIQSKQVHIPAKAAKVFQAVRLVVLWVFGAMVNHFPLVKFDLARNSLEQGPLTRQNYSLYR